MQGTRIVADIRRHRGGDAAFVIGLVKCFCARFGAATADWLLRPDQCGLIPPESVIGVADQSDSSWGRRIQDHILQFLKSNQDATGGAVLVLSYDNTLLNEIRSSFVGQKAIRTKHLSELFAMGIHREVQRQRLAPTVLGMPPSFGSRSRFREDNNPATAVRDAPLTMAEAVSLARQVLRQGHHVSEICALPQKDLRLRMTQLDSRAARFRGDQTSESLITDLVDEGLQQGWLKRFRRLPSKTGTEMIFLNEAAAAIPLSQGGGPECSLPDIAVAVQNVPTPVTRDMQFPPQPSAPPVQMLSAPDGVSSLAADKKKHPNRATEFEAILSKSRIGSMPETREHLFNSLEEILSEDGHAPIPMLELFKAAEDRARARSAEAGYASEQNWVIARICNQRLMLRAGVLIGEDGQPIADRIGSNAKKVSSLEPEFRRTCEAYLAEHVIEKSSAISYDDGLYYLGLVLYRRGKARAVPAEELKSKADAVLAFLDERGRILLDGDGMLRIKAPRARSLAVAG